MFINISQATVYHVRENGSDTKDGKSWDNSFATIQKALDNVKYGDEIWVGQGTYYPSNKIDSINLRYNYLSLIDDIGLYGGFPPNGNPDKNSRNFENYKTLISGDIGVKQDTSDNSYYLIGLFDSLSLNKGAIIDGFAFQFTSYSFYIYKCNVKIVNCSFTENYYGCIFNTYGKIDFENCKFYNNDFFSAVGAILSYSTYPITVRNTIFENNRSIYSSFGIGIYNGNSADIEISDCSFKNNSCSSGGCIFNPGGKLIVKRTKFINNSSEYDGGAIHSTGELTVSNCLFADNFINNGYGGAIYTIGNSNIYNSTFINNHSEYSGAISFGGIASIYNSIFWDNTATINYHDIISYDNLTIKNSCFRAGSDYISGNFIQENCINQNPKIYTKGDNKGLLYTNSPCIDKGNNVFLNEEFDLRGNGYPRKLKGSDGTPGTIDIGAYEYNFTTDKNDITSKSLVYVKYDAVGKNDGSSWNDAFTKLQDALETYTEDNLQIWVAAGTYYPSLENLLEQKYQSFLLKDKIALYGGFKGIETNLSQRDWIKNKTILSGDVGKKGDSSDNCYNVIKIFSVINDSNSILDGFIITGGNATSTNSKGGGIISTNSETKISNCIFELNYANEGAGIYINNGKHTLINCTFNKNLSRFGAGLYAKGKSNLTINNSLFQENYSQSAGSGIFSKDKSILQISNSNFKDNTSFDIGGAIYSDSSNFLISNCSFDKNITLYNEGSGIYSVYSDITLKGCNFKENNSKISGSIYSKYDKYSIDSCNFISNVAKNGAGIYAFQSDLIISKSHFENNISDGGSGIHNRSSKITITESLFKGNKALTPNVGKGGAIYYYSQNQVIKSCQFIENSSLNGGAIFNDQSSNGIIEGCIFNNNTAILGGAVYNKTNTTNIKSCNFIKNNAESGSSIYNDQCKTITDKCTFIDNIVTGKLGSNGGTVFINGNQSTISNCQFKNNTGEYGSNIYILQGSPQIINSLIVKDSTNSGGSIYIKKSKPSFINCTITGNAEVLGPLIYSTETSEIKLTNSIVWSEYNTGNEFFVSKSKFNVLNSCLNARNKIDSSFTFQNCIVRNPRFINKGEHSFCLSSDSPCLDAGENASVTENNDIRGDGFGRKLNSKNNSDGIVDVGAYEYKYGTDIATISEKRIIYVNSKSTGLNNGTNWQDAFTTFQLALDNAGYGNEIWVAEGSYSPTKTIHNISTDSNYAFYLKNETSYYGGFPSTGNPAFSDRNPDIYKTELNGKGRYYVLYNIYLENNVIIDGFEIINANNISTNSQGAGIYNNLCSAVFKNCKIYQNNAYDGAGIINSNSNPKFENCEISKNTAKSKGGALYNLNSDVYFKNCTFRENKSNIGGSSYDYNSKSIYINCKFLNNSGSSYGLQIYSDSSTSAYTNCEFDNKLNTRNAINDGGCFYLNKSNITLKNCTVTNHNVNNLGGFIYSLNSNSLIVNSTIYDNYSRNGGGIYIEGGKSEIQNSILCRNRMHLTEGKGQEIYNKSGIVSIKNSCFLYDSINILGNIEKINCIHQNPQFRLRLKDPMALKNSSPCIDAGQNDLVDEEFDIRGTGFPRKLDTKSMEIGKVDMGAYEFNSGKDPELEFKDIIIYVKQNANGKNTGLNWNDAFNSFQDALDFSLEGDTICVAEGIYKPSKVVSLSSSVPNYPSNSPRNFAFQLKNKRTIYGGYSSNGNPSINERNWELFPSILSGDIGITGDKTDNCLHIIVHTVGLVDSTAKLDGFIIKNGYADSRNDYLASYGGGIINLNSSPVILNCTFSGNYSLENGSAAHNGNYNSNDSVIMISSKPQYINCNFIKNQSDYGGAVFNGKNNEAAFINCNFVYNSAIKAGAVHNSTSDSYFNNCKFYNNSATDKKYDGGGAILNSNSNSLMENCIFKDNSGLAGGGIINYKSNLSLINCLMLNNTAFGTKSSGGAILNINSTMNIINCTLSENKASFGGAISNNTGNLNINNSIISSNFADSTGIQIFNYGFNDTIVTTLNNTCISNNNKDIDGKVEFVSCLFENPDFIGTGDYPFLLNSSSPCIDAGNNEFINSKFDIRGENFKRKLNGANGSTGIVDMGAYEFNYGIDNITPLSSVVLESPANNSISIDTLPQLKWQTKDYAVSYDLQLSDNSAFVSNIVQLTSYDQTNYTLTTKLMNDTKYYWRVRAKNNNNVYGLWSEVWSFTTLTVAQPTKTKLVSPLNNSKDIPLNITLQWENQSTNFHFQIQISLDNLFTSNIFNDEVYEPKWKKLLEPKTKYFWRVRTLNSSGLIGVWSDIWTFTTSNLVKVEEDIVNNGITFQNFGDKYQISFTNTDEQLIDLAIYNIVGERIDYIPMINTNNSIQISNENLISGLYFIKVTTNYQNTIFKIMHIN
jgi:predicted outer membrane repeat protein